MALQTGPGREALGAWGLSAPAEPYAEIAFAKPELLPPPVVDGAVAVPVWIRNEEGARRAFEWTATVDGASTAAASGRLTLDDGAGRTVAVRVPVSCTGARARVNVSLGGTHRTIGFWLPCDGSAP